MILPDLALEVRAKGKQLLALTQRTVEERPTESVTAFYGRID